MKTPKPLYPCWICSDECDHLHPANDLYYVGKRWLCGSCAEADDEFDDKLKPPRLDHVLDASPIKPELRRNTPPQPSKGKYLTGLLGETITADCVADTTIDQAQRLAVERGHDMIYERNGLVYGRLIVHKVVSENVGGTGWRTVE